VAWGRNIGELQLEGVVFWGKGGGEARGGGSCSHGQVYGPRLKDILRLNKYPKKRSIRP
jgi:hypothetical protein